LTKLGSPSRAMPMALLAVSGGFLHGASPAHSQALRPLQTISGVCSPDPVGGSIVGAPFAQNHDAVFAVVTGSAGLSGVEVAAGSSEHVTWNLDNTGATHSGTGIFPLPVLASSVPYLVARCWRAPRQAVSASFFDVPTPPVTYPTLQLAGGLDTPSVELPYVVRSRVRFETDVTVTSGFASVNGGASFTGTQTFAAERFVPRSSVRVRASSPQTAVQVAVRPVPVQVSGMVISRSVRQNEPSTLAYSADGETKVTIHLVDASGQTRKTYGPFDYPGDSASRVLEVDGRDQAGARAPDGNYTFVLRSEDAYGGRSERSFPAIFDSTGPAIAADSASTTQSPVAVRVSDSNGVASVSAGVEGTTPATIFRSPYAYKHRLETLLVRPPALGGWKSGSTSILVDATDAHGNRSTIRHTVGVLPPARSSSPPASRPAPMPARVSLRTARSGGVWITGKARANKARVHASLRLSARDARQLKMPRVLGTRTLRVTNRSSRTFGGYVRISRRAEQRLRRRKAISVRVAVAGGASQRSSITLLR